MTHRIFTGCVDDHGDRVEVLVQIWDDGDDSVAELALRSDPSHTWGPPIRLEEA
jgi:hypothetical protein